MDMHDVMVKISHKISWICKLIINKLTYKWQSATLRVNGNGTKLDWRIEMVRLGFDCNGSEDLAAPALTDWDSVAEVVIFNLVEGIKPRVVLVQAELQ